MYADNAGIGRAQADGAQTTCAGRVSCRRSRAFPALLDFPNIDGHPNS
jgi:hypothetical protein